MTVELRRKATAAQRLQDFVIGIGLIITAGAIAAGLAFVQGCAGYVADWPDRFELKEIERGGETIRAHVGPCRTIRVDVDETGAGFDHQGNVGVFRCCYGEPEQCVDMPIFVLQVEG